MQDNGVKTAIAIFNTVSFVSQSDERRDSLLGI
jgi:hypothetical protein